MRHLYDWYIPLSTEQLGTVWENAILTVDANVLLDLYRYHEQTRLDLLNSLEQFSGRLWLSHQAAKEFIKNRTTVIAGAAKTFEDAETALKTLEKSLQTARDALRGLRLVPRELTAVLSSGIRDEIASARLALKTAQEAHPNYFRTDPILERILSLFDKAVGKEPTAEERKEHLLEADRRKKEKIPPGYLDASKDGDDAYGDYFLWVQVLACARATQRPMILVTSERKDDWWERHNGQRVGPRVELLREAAENTGQRILIYETDHFVKSAAERSGRSVEPSVVEEIRSVGQKRAQSIFISEAEAESTIESVAHDFAYKLPDSDPIASLIAETNAFEFYPDEVEVLSIGDFDFDTASMPFSVRIHFAGEQHEDRMWYGNGITAMLNAELHFNGDEWEIADDYKLTAEIDRDEH